DAVLIPPPRSVVVSTEPIEIEGVRRREPGNIAASVADEMLQRWNVGGRGDPGYISNRANYHPGTRVVVEVGRDGKHVSQSSRRSTLQRVEANLRKYGYWPLRICFEDAARFETDAGGTTQLRLSIGTRGAVIGARVMRSDLKHRGIAQCQASALRRLKVEGTWSRPWSVGIKVSVWPGDVPLLPLGRPEAKPPIQPLPSMTEAIRQLDGPVAECFQEARQNDEKLWGRLAVSFAVAATGNPSEFAEYQTHFGSPDALRCVSRALATLTFEQSETSPRFVASWRLHPSDVAIVDVGNPDASNSTPADR
ncbi:MAG TPA: hypothetical protein VIV60_04065, partial [Polyangiaceae bacterium]